MKQNNPFENLVIASFVKQKAFEILLSLEDLRKIVKSNIQIEIIDYIENQLNALVESTSIEEQEYLLTQIYLLALKLKNNENKMCDSFKDELQSKTTSLIKKVKLKCRISSKEKIIEKANNLECLVSELKDFYLDQEFIRW